jgi:hypothetical protein
MIKNRNHYLFMFFFLYSSVVFASGANFNSTTQLPLTPNAAGNVGISSANPGQLLDVQGTVRMLGLTLTGNGAASGNVLVGNGVGVGTWMPVSTLGAAGGSNYWLLNGGAGNVGINTINAVGIGTSFVGGTGEATLSVMNGNVGIGTWVPGVLLQIGNATTGSGGGAAYGINIGASGANLYSAFGNNSDLETDASVLYFSQNAATIYGSGGDINLEGSGGTTQGPSVTLEAHSNFSATSGDQNLENIWITFNPTSGTSIFEGLAVTPTINQTGGASGITRGIWVGSVLTAAYDYRAIETDYGNVGIGTISGNLGIGSQWPGQRLDVSGTARMTGFTLSGNGAANGNVLVGNSVGVGTWMPVNTLGAAGGSNYWLLNGGAGNVGINTINAVGIGTSFVGGTGEATLSVMNGNVGIGTWVPGALLQVGTGANWLQFATNGLLTVNNNGIVIADGSSFAGGDTYFITGTTSSNWAQSNGGAGVNAITVSYNTATATNVGINVSGTPGGALEVEGGNVGIGTSKTLTAGLSVMNGNVGIGTWIPALMLDVNGTVRMTGFNIANGAGSGKVLTSDASGNGTWGAAGAGSNYWLLNGGAGNVGINTINAVGIGTSFVGGTGEAALSVMNGNVGIGTWVPGYTLTVVSNGSAISGSNPSNSGSGVYGASSGYATGVVGYSLFGIGVIGQAGASSGTNPGVEAESNGTGPGLLAENTTTGPAAVFSPGNVGIGSTVPGKALDVNGTVRMTGFNIANGAGSGKVLTSDASGNGTWGAAGAGSNYWLLNGGAGNIGINTINAVGIGTSFVGGTGEAAFAVTNGNVGIGTWVPANIFQIGNGTTPALSVDQGGDVTTGGDITIGNFNNLYIDAGSVVETATGGGSIQFGGGPAYLNLQTGANSAIYIDANSNVGIGTKTTVGGLSVMNGNVGIGTWIPALILDVNGTARMKGFTLTGNGAANGDILVGNSVGVGTWMATSTLTAGLLNSATVNQVAYYSGVTALSGNSKFVFIPVSGNVGIGTIGPTSVLQVVGNVGIGTTTAASTPYTLNINNIAVFNGEYNNGSPTSPITINWAKGNKQAVTLTATGMTIDFTNPSVGVGMFQLKLIQGVASSTVTTWTPSSGNIYWAGGSAPTLTTTVNYLDIVSCYYDGTNYYCSATLDFQ